MDEKLFRKEGKYVEYYVGKHFLLTYRFCRPILLLITVDKGHAATNQHV